ncbi:2-hydroxyacid dehydrogenase [Caproiciproducens sp. LBM24188]|nr:hydroxyacid dehydrogenase [Oscillospiraceae bacterium]HHV32903.1 hydroxyacid dehydrogenase [Clostridiales bacterium]
MKIVAIEPLGVEKSKLMELSAEKLPESTKMVFYDTRVTDTASLIERGKDADVILVANLPLNADVINGCKNLKLLDVAFTGTDHIDLAACRARGITVCNCSGYSDAAVSDLVFGMILSLYRNIGRCNEAVRKGKTRDGLIGFELEGKKFGVVGTGAIGLRTAAIAKVFGCEVYAYSRTVKQVEGIAYTDLETLMSACDIISLHVPYNESTRGMISKELIARMKPNALLINTARGPVLDSQALADALNEGRIAGAGIDVFESEPPISPEHPLLTAKNVIATPHVAFATKEALVKRAAIAFDNIQAYLNRKPIHVVC